MLLGRRMNIITCKEASIINVALRKLHTKHLYTRRL
jgi:hypothetical protein